MMPSKPVDGNAPAETPINVRLLDDVHEAVSFQSYEPQPAVAGVELIRLRKHRAQNGWFAEIFRLDGGSVQTSAGGSLELRQVSTAYADPHRINAFHIHPKVPQDELWVVLQGSLTVWLVDCRKDSESSGVRQRVQLSGEEPALLSIPAGVAHGYRAGKDGALLLYAMNQQFDARDPNEGRLPWDHFGREIWEEDRG
jgi:dTDP-4-dehydrorhamnose 3,5-epimerase